jgi:hypothetical protein
MKGEADMAKDLKKEVPQLGDLVRDEVTGREGIVVAYSKHLTGCDRITVQPQQTDKGGKLPEAYSHDITTCVVLKQGVVVPRTFEQEPRSERPGGPAELASERAW